MTSFEAALKSFSPQHLATLPRPAVAELCRILAELAARRSRITLQSYRPYPKQREFHAAGATHRERLFLAGNQLGKTLAGGCEVAFHLTGLYPDWWQGKRFDRPIAMWAASDTTENTRDRNQRILLGRVEQIGTGVVPGALIDFASIAMRRGVANAVDGLRIKHVSGASSLLMFKSYDQGRPRWQGETLDAVWFDEEPPAAIYAEGLTRTNATGGIALATATPLLGMTAVVGYFYPRPATPDRHLTQMTIAEAAHYSDEERARIIAAYPAHERDARARGIPMLGSGRIFPVADSAVTTAPFLVPGHWPQLGAMDFGWDHPFAAVRVAHDRDADVVYVTQCYRIAQQTPLIHCGALRAWGDWLRWAWPADGLGTEKGSGEPLKTQYARQGLNMLPEHARTEDGSVSVEAGLFEMLTRMQTGRLKVFAHLGDWLEEFRQYHRKDGKVVKERDDLMAATRYAIMALRFAALPRTKPPAWLRGEGGRARSFMAG